MLLPQNLVLIKPVHHHIVNWVTPGKRISFSHRIWSTTISTLKENVLQITTINLLLSRIKYKKKMIVFQLKSIAVVPCTQYTTRRLDTKLAARRHSYVANLVQFSLKSAPSHLFYMSTRHGYCKRVT